MNLNGKSVVITGANRGIGWALAQALASKGSDLGLVVRSKNSVSQDQLESLKKLGSKKVEIFELDLTRIDQISPVMDLVIEKMKPYVVINNAGLLTGGLLENQDQDEIVKLIQVNITALTLITQKFLAHFIKQKEGKIVNNASVMGAMRFPASTVYAGSKAYVIGLTDSLRQETRGTGVTTLVMYTPGVKTDMFDDIADRYGSHIDLDFLSSIPASEWAKKVVRSMEKDDEEARPSGATGIGLTLSRYFPKAFEALIATKFHR
ncbi:SDR family NAD(P)-dependent oxidoreductase [bacterium]|nr:SDR family NAD(P)-dependent oxidoreductase [bacterium]